MSRAKFKEYMDYSIPYFQNIRVFQGSLDPCMKENRHLKPLNLENQYINLDLDVPRLDLIGE